jgi:hypothetical protein
MRRLRFAVAVGLSPLLLGNACDETLVEPDIPDFVLRGGWYEEGEWRYEHEEEHGYWRCTYVRPDGVEMTFQCGRLHIGIQPNIGDEDLADLWEEMGLKDTPTFHRDHPYRGARGWVEMGHEPVALRIADADPRTRYASLNWTGPAAISDL